jgi:transcriptional regulator with XRE-family HTH domain
MTVTLTHSTDRGPTAVERAFLRQLGRNLRIQRVTSELSQQQLADAASMSRNFVSSIERGAHGVDIVRLVRLAVALRTGWEQLVPPISVSAEELPVPPAGPGQLIGEEPCPDA